MLLRSFEDLDAWQEAHQMTLAVYRATRSFPSDERFGVTSQLRRAATSIEANLAEGFGRRSTKELLRFSRIADGSLQEVQCFLRIALDLEYLPTDRYAELRAQAQKVGRLIGGLQHYLNTKLQGTNR
jgi:four helix bundle protein